MSDKKSTMNKEAKRALLALGVIVVVALILLISAGRPMPAPQKTAMSVPTPYPTSVAKTSLLLAQNPPSTKTPNSVSVLIDSTTNSVTGVQLNISFDPKAIADVAVTPGNFFKNPTILKSSVNTKTGEIVYSLAVGPNAGGVNGKGVLALITYQPLTTQPSKLEFLHQTLVTASGIVSSVLGSVQGVTLRK